MYAVFSSNSPQVARSQVSCVDPVWSKVRHEGFVSFATLPTKREGFHHTTSNCDHVTLVCTGDLDRNLHMAVSRANGLNSACMVTTGCCSVIMIECSQPRSRDRSLYRRFNHFAHGDIMYQTRGKHSQRDRRPTPAKCKVRTNIPMRSSPS